MRNVELQAFTIDVSHPLPCVLVASLHLPQDVKELGVLLLAGGHQTRAGSHRQFLKLARQFSAEGYPCLRFDFPGLGDASGAVRPFDDNVVALRAAVDALLMRAPSIKRVVLWGLCDGASAAALYAGSDARVSALVMVNPWVRTWQVQSQTLIKSYYRKRLMSVAFWQKLLRGELQIVRSATEWFGHWRAAREDRKAGSCDLPERLKTALREFRGSTQIIIGEQDLTGQEFRLVAQALEGEAHITLSSIEGADHTFSTVAWHQQLALLSLAALARERSDLTA